MTFFRPVMVWSSNCSALIWSAHLLHLWFFKQEFTFLLCASCFLQKVSCYCTSGRKTWEEGDWRDTIQQQAIFTGSEGENVPEVVLKKWEVMVCQSLHVVFIILSTLISYFESLEFFFVFFAIPACTSLLDPHMSASSLSNYTQPQCCSCINTIPLYRF